MLHDRRLSWLSFPFSVLLVSFCLSRSLHAQTSDVEQRLDEIRAKMMEEREKLKTGSFKVVGRETRYDQRNYFKKLTTLVEVHQVFDRPGERQRYEFHSKVKVPIDAETPLTGETLKEMREKAERARRNYPDRVSKAVQARHYVADWSAAGGFGEPHAYGSDLTIRDSWHGTDARFEKPFDPTAVGLISHRDFRLGRSLEAAWSELEDDFLNLEIADLDDQVVQLTFWYEHSCCKLEIDTRNGYTIRRLEKRYLDPEGQPKESPFLVGTTSWKLVNEVWVPTEYSARYDQLDGNYRSQDYRFVWETMNLAPDFFDDDLFTYKSLTGIPEGTRVIDRRGVPDASQPVISQARPKLLGVIGPNGDIVEDETLRSLYLELP